MADAKRLQRTLGQLIESQPDDERLRDHLEGVVRDEHFSALTWYWGPLLYERNRVVFRAMILNYFSDWERSLLAWKRIKWSTHQERLQAWLDAARSNRDTHLVRRLFRWKYAAKKWGVDAAAWNAALLRDYETARSAAARAIVLDEYDDWFEMDENTAVSLYRCDPTCGDFLLKHLPQSFWGGEKRKLWERLSKAALEAEDEKLQLALYRRQVPLKQWQEDVLSLARHVPDPEQLRTELISLGYGYPVATVLAILMSEAPRQPVAAEGKVYHVPVGPRVCVQGAPTSPGLCNAVLMRLDRRIAGLARKNDFQYTRYADDLTLSGDDASKIKLFISVTSRIVQDEGFRLNLRKTRVLRQASRQRVTGVIVNQQLGLSRVERRRLRAEIHQLTGDDKRARKRLEGKLAYLQMLNPEQAKPLQRAFIAACGGSIDGP